MSELASGFARAWSPPAEAAVELIDAGVGGINFFARTPAQSFSTLDLAAFVAPAVEDLELALSVLAGLGYRFERGTAGCERNHQNLRRRPPERWPRRDLRDRRIQIYSARRTALATFLAFSRRPNRTHAWLHRRFCSPAVHEDSLGENSSGASSRWMPSPALIAGPVRRCAPRLKGRKSPGPSWDVSASRLELHHLPPPGLSLLPAPQFRRSADPREIGGQHRSQPPRDHDTSHRETAASRDRHLGEVRPPAQPRA